MRSIVLLRAAVITGVVLNLAALNPAVADTVVGAVIVVVDLKHHDLLEFRQAQACQTVRFSVASLIDAAERRAPPLVDAPHHGADQPLDRAMMFGMAFLSHLRSDAVQAEAALDAFRFVFRPWSYSRTSGLPQTGQCTLARSRFASQAWAGTRERGRSRP